MSADILRKAAERMRERAEAAVLSPWEAVEGASGDWWVERPDTADIALDLHGENARHIASWHPAVALAVADLLFAAADSFSEASMMLAHPWDDETCQCLSHVEWRAYLALARAYLGEAA